MGLVFIEEQGRELIYHQTPALEWSVFFAQQGLPLGLQYLHSQKGVPEIDMVQEQLHSSRYVIIYPGVLFQISVKDLFFFAKHCTF